MPCSSHSITFNPNKSKLLCYNADLTSNVPQVDLNSEKIPVVDSDKIYINEAIGLLVTSEYVIAAL